MVVSEIKEFSLCRTKARAYFCYLFSKNIPNRLPSLTQEMIVPRMLKIKEDLEQCEGVYLLDSKGVQVSATYTQNGRVEEDIGVIRADRAYYYRAVREARCSITDPYPSLLTHELTVTASQPIYCENGNLKYVACLDMPLAEVIKIAHLNKMDSFLNNLFKIAYALFSVALVAVAMFLFFKGVHSFFAYEVLSAKFDVKEMFEATILLTLALAIFDLSKTLVEEEIMGQSREHNIAGPHKTMVRFLGSIIIALSIEALMLVFKFAITEPDQLIYAMYIIGGVAMLLAGLAVYIKFTKVENQE
ncbi:MAG: PDC sensor domain-containing protein [Epsilonproteobacteria bacterium]|nr:PDC sensor domain-containing protein [Campylobacterota bacterium]